MSNSDQSITRASDLLTAVDDHGALLPNVGLHRDALAEAIRRLQTLREHRRKLEAERQSATQQFNTELRHLEDLTSHVRTIIKGNLGLRNEKLKLFGIVPLGSRPRKRWRLSERQIEGPDMRQTLVQVDR